jgi:hypothetical protein
MHTYIVKEVSTADPAKTNGVVLHSAQVAQVGGVVKRGDKTIQLKDKAVGWITTFDDKLEVGDSIDYDEKLHRVNWLTANDRVIHLAVNEQEREDRKAVLAAGGYEKQQESIKAMLMADAAIAGNEG